jgi:hypothetical protein
MSSSSWVSWLTDGMSSGGLRLGRASHRLYCRARSPLVPLSTSAMTSCAQVMT